MTVSKRGFQNLSIIISSSSKYVTASNTYIKLHKAALAFNIQRPFCLPTRDLPTLPLFGSHACFAVKKKTCQHQVWRGLLCGSFCVQVGGLPLHQPPPLLNPSMLTINRSCFPMFALGVHCANHFVCKWGGAAPHNLALLHTRR